MKLNDRVVVVTGAGSGMGRELTLGLLSRGAAVAAIDLRPETLAETVALADAGDRLATFEVDISDRTAVELLPEKVIGALGAVDAVINNAGIMQPFVPIAELDYRTIDRLVDVNLYGTVYMVKAFLPHLMARPEAHIANVSSMGGFLPVPGQGVYGATKAAVKLLTEALYAEMRGTAVGVSVIMPGAIRTNITENSGVDMPEMSAEDMEKAAKRTMPAADAANVILEGIEANKLHILVGSDAKMMSVASRTAPKRAIHFIANQMEDLLG